MDASSASLDLHNTTRPEQRHDRIQYLREFYSYLNIELLQAWVWSSCAVFWYDDFGKHLFELWYIALITGVICIQLILVAFFAPKWSSQGGPCAIYILFTQCFMYTWGYLSLCGRDESNTEYRYIGYYIQTCLWLTTSSFALYSWCNSSYMAAISGIVYIVGANAQAFQIFLIWSDISIIWQSLVMLLVMAFGFYINNDLVKMVRAGIFEPMSESRYLAAVRVWIETILVFCRMIELIGCIFSRNSDIRGQGMGIKSIGYNE